MEEVILGLERKTENIDKSKVETYNESEYHIKNKNEWNKDWNRTIK